MINSVGVELFIVWGLCSFIVCWQTEVPSGELWGITIHVTEADDNDDAAAVVVVVATVDDVDNITDDDCCDIGTHWVWKSTNWADI